MDTNGGWKLVKHAPVGCHPEEFEGSGLDRWRRPATRPRCLDSARNDRNSDDPCPSVVGSGFQYPKRNGNGAGNGGQTTNGANGTNIGGENGANGRSAFSGGSNGLICVHLRSETAVRGMSRDLTAHTKTRRCKERRRTGNLEYRRPNIECRRGR